MKNKFILILLTPLFFLLTHAMAYLVHEYAHAFSAFFLGFKTNPLALNYGHFNLKNLLLLNEVTENVNYDAFDSSHPWIGAFVAFSGPFIGNGLFYGISLYGLSTSKSSAAFYFYYLLAVMNLGNFIDYVPIRTFGTHGDIHEIVSCLKISPWWIMVVIGYPVFYIIRHFYHVILPKTYKRLNLSWLGQKTLLIFTSIILFTLFGSSGLNGYGELSAYTSMWAIFLTPWMIILYWNKN